MPLQNRVDPWGQLHSIPSRAATVMGNRGILHDSERRIVRRWATKSWVACDPHYKGISRKPLFKPGSYSELFFLDEATALAAGHRPCAYCQRGKYNSFKNTWFKTLPAGSTATLGSGAIDQQLHAERVAPGIEKVPRSGNLSTLPEGVLFEHEGQAILIHQGKLWRWSFDGYVAASPISGVASVSVLTPPSVVRVLAAGYKPQVHPTADA